MALGPAVLGAEAALAARGGPDLVAPAAGACVSCAAGGRPVRTVWLGDSTAAGVGASTGAAVLGRQVAERLGRPVEVRVLAVSGARVADVLRSQAPTVPADTDVVLVSVGANDATHLTSTGTFRSTYRRLLGSLPTGARVVVLGVPDLGSPPRLAQPLRALAGSSGRRLDRVVAAEARRAGAAYVDIARATGPSFRADHRLFAADRFHPSDAGYARWADAVVPALRPLLPAT